MYLHKCDTCKYEVSPHAITLDDNYLFKRTLYFCNWKCVRIYMEKHKFAVKKERLFAIEV